jgi:primosomal protein N' (replication factor Y)
MDRRSGTENANQPSLLQGFTSPAHTPGQPQAAPVNPVARVLPDSPVPHLDREFDYLVPASMDAQAQPGVRVKVRLGAQELSGFITQRLPGSDSGSRLIPLGGVVSGQPVLDSDVLALARSVATRYAGTVSDVLRAAIPPRLARVEKEFPLDSPVSPAIAASAAAGEAGSVTGSGYGRYTGGPEFLGQLAAGQNPRSALSTLGGYRAGPDSGTWADEIAQAVAAVWQAGRGAVVVVPDQRDLLRVESAVAELVGAENVARLTGEDGPTPRYRSFLKLLHGQVRIAVGTRSAAYAPVRNLGLVCLWDDGDESHVEQRAPYQHAREVLLLRAEQQGCAVLLASVARSTEVQRLVETGWARDLAAPRSEVRRRTPRVLHSADSYHSARDPLASRARIPHAAWLAARQALECGPVLLQVARTGFSPALACQDCRESARCADCAGPLAQHARGAVPACRWCGRPEPAWLCPACGSGRLRASAAGAARTAEELGRAFPGVPVVSSAGAHVVDRVPARPAVVVATPGAEPVAEGGYAAVILLDGNAMLSRESLRAGEDTLRRWFNAAILARPLSAGGTVVVTADDASAAGHLVRWDPAGSAARELLQRQELGLPPAVRYAAVDGSREALGGFMAGLDLPAGVRTAGPAPSTLAPQPGAEQRRAGSLTGRDLHQLLVFFPYRSAEATVGALKARKAALSARRSSEPVQVRCDAPGLL